MTMPSPSVPPFFLQTLYPLLCIPATCRDQFSFLFCALSPAHCIVIQIISYIFLSKTISSPRESLKPLVDIIFSFSLWCTLVWIGICQTFLLTEESFFQMNPTIWHIHRTHIQRTITWLKVELLFEMEAGNGPETTLASFSTS